MGTQGYAAPEYVATGRLYLSVNHSIGLTLSIRYILGREREREIFLTHLQTTKNKSRKKPGNKTKGMQRTICSYQYEPPLTLGLEYSKSLLRQLSICSLKEPASWLYFPSLTCLMFVFPTYYLLILCTLHKASLPIHPYSACALNTV